MTTSTATPLERPATIARGMSGMAVASPVAARKISTIPANDVANERPRYAIFTDDSRRYRDKEDIGRTDPDLRFTETSGEKPGRCRTENAGDWTQSRGQCDRNTDGENLGCQDQARAHVGTKTEPVVTAKAQR